MMWVWALFLFCPYLGPDAGIVTATAARHSTDKAYRYASLDSAMQHFFAELCCQLRLCSEVMHHYTTTYLWLWGELLQSKCQYAGSHTCPTAGHQRCFQVNSC